MTNQFDEVNRPRHYADSPIVCIDAMEAALGIEAVVYFCQGNAFKYAWRAGKKGDMATDLRKAAWYATKAAELLDKHARLPRARRHGTTTGSTGACVVTAHENGPQEHE